MMYYSGYVLLVNFMDIVYCRSQLKKTLDLTTKSNRHRRVEKNWWCHGRRINIGLKVALCMNVYS